MRDPHKKEEFSATRKKIVFIFLLLFQFFSLGSLLLANPGFAENSAGGRREKPGPGDFDLMKNRLQELEDQLRDLESKTVLSEPEMIIKQKEIWVCGNGHEYDDFMDGKCPIEGLALHKESTYQREKVYRRQTIGEQIQNALDERESRGINIGVSSTATLQETYRVSGEDEGAQDLFGVGSADIYFIGKPALYTLFFLDIEAIGGSSPDLRIDNVSLLTSDVARREVDKRANVREVWLRTELLDQKLTISAGMLDLTNYFDLNAVANDETLQFITDGLVNNILLAPPSNGAGIVAAYDPKTGVIFRAGAQRGASDKPGLAKKVYSLFEVEYLAHIPGLQIGHYRAWVRIDENSKRENIAWGVSADQKLTAAVTLFARFGNRFTSDKYSRDDYFYSGGIEMKTPYTFGIQDSFAIAFLGADMARGVKESLMEAYYNLFLTENVRTSFHIQYLINSNEGGKEKSYLLPGLRVQLDF